MDKVAYGINVQYDYYIGIAYANSPLHCLSCPTGRFYTVSKAAQIAFRTHIKNPISIIFFTKFKEQNIFSIISLEDQRFRNFYVHIIICITSSIIIIKFFHI